MRNIDALLALADAYSKATNLAEATISTRVLQDGKRLSAIRAGKDIGMRRLEEAIEWFSENWPAEAKWPRTVDRPSRQRVAS